MIRIFTWLHTIYGSLWLQLSKVFYHIGLPGISICICIHLHNLQMWLEGNTNGNWPPDDQPLNHVGKRKKIMSIVIIAFISLLILLASVEGRMNM